MKTILHDLEVKREGWEDGWTGGEQAKLISQIQKKLLKGESLDVIAGELEEAPEFIEPIYELLKAYPTDTPERIYERLQMRRV